VRPASALPDGAWRLSFPRDSRNCGDVVMPTIAAHSAQFAPSFYWHLVAICGRSTKLMKTWRSQREQRQVLACDAYQRRAWTDFR